MAGGLVEVAKDFGVGKRIRQPHCRLLWERLHRRMVNKPLRAAFTHPAETSALSLPCGGAAWQR